MTTTSRRAWSWWRSVAVAVLAVIASAGAARAQWTVYDPANFGYQVMHYGQRAQQLYNQARQLEYQIQALRKLGSPNWRQIGDLMYRLGAIQAEAAAIGASFEEMFPGFQVPANYPGQSRIQTVRALNTVRQTMQAMHLLGENAANAQGTLSRIQQQLGSVDGHQEALELQSTLMGLTTQEVAALRETVSAQANAQAVYQGYMLQQQAASQSAYEQTLARFNTRRRAPEERVDGSWRRP